ncbi:MAG: carbohydrate ABC transporter permease, partial [Marinomonas sp.]
MSSVLIKNESRLGLKLVVPAVGIIGLLVIYPILFNIYLSFFDVQLNGTKAFVGMENYTDLLGNPRYYHSIGVSVIYLIGTVAGTTILGLAAAILMNQEFRFRNLARGLILLPYFAPV